MSPRYLRQTEAGLWVECPKDEATAFMHQKDGVVIPEAAVSICAGLLFVTYEGNAYAWPLQPKKVLAPWLGTGPEPPVRFDISNKEPDALEKLDAGNLVHDNEIIRNHLIAVAGGQDAWETLANNVEKADTFREAYGIPDRRSNRFGRRMMVHRLRTTPGLINQELYDDLLTRFGWVKGINAVTRAESVVLRQVVEDYWVQLQFDRQSFLFRFVESLSLLPRPNLRFRDMVDYKGIWGSQVWWL